MLASLEAGTVEADGEAWKRIALRRNAKVSEDGLHDFPADEELVVAGVGGGGVDAVGEDDDHEVMGGVGPGGGAGKA